MAVISVIALYRSAGATNQFSAVPTLSPYSITFNLPATSTETRLRSSRAGAAAFAGGGPAQQIDWGKELLDERRRSTEAITELTKAVQALQRKDGGFFSGRFWDVFQAGGIVVAGYALLLSVKSQRLANLFAITTAHRDIWWKVANDPSLHRIIDPSADIGVSPITEQERHIVLFVIAHVNTCLKFTKHGMLIKVEQLQKDVRELFSLPIPKAVWNEVRDYQDQDVLNLIEGT